MSELPFSPSARAFFAAFDDASNNNNNNNNNNNSNNRNNHNHHEIGGKNSARSSSSNFIQKRIQTLGWRNRYSQEEYYPIEIEKYSFLSSDDETTTSCCYKFSVQQIQRGEVDGTYGTGATVWPASIVLIKYLQKHADKLILGKRIIDLGTGTGITSIAIALLGGTNVICTDGEDSVVQLARTNIQHAQKELFQQHDNQQQQIDNHNNEPDPSSSSTNAIITIQNCSIDVQFYWWGSGTIQQDDNNACDVIIISDCVLPKLYPLEPLVNAIDELLIKPNAIAILSYEYRYYEHYDPKSKFEQLCTDKNLVLQVVPVQEHDPIYSVDDIEIWHVQRQQFV